MGLGLQTRGMTPMNLMKMMPHLMALTFHLSSLTKEGQVQIRLALVLELRCAGRILQCAGIAALVLGMSNTRCKCEG